MTGDADHYSARTAELRRAFDQSFATARAAAADELENVLTFGLSLAGGRFAVRLNELSGIAKCPRLTSVPSRSRALLGLAGIRGELLPVFSLAGLLNDQSTEAIQWILLCREPTRAGLGIGEFFGCFKTPKTAFSRADHPSGNGPLQEVVVLASKTYTVVNISFVTQLIVNPAEGA